MFRQLSGDTRAEGSAIVLCLICLPLMVVGCDPQSWSSRTPPYGEDSWGHYVGGGVFPTNSGSMSPDGSTLVYASPESGHGDICAVNLSEGTRRRLTTSDDFESFPVFSPDGKRVAFVREANRRRHVWIMNSDGSNLKRLTFGDVLDDLREFSRDGHRLLIWRSPAQFGLGRIGDMYILDLDSPDIELTAIGEYASFGPDGKMIVYNPVDRFDEVWLKETDDSEPRRIGSGSVPIFSPNGDSVLVRRDKNHGEWQLDGQIWLLSIDGTRSQRIGAGSGACFLPKGGHIAYYRGYDQEIRVYDIETKKTVNVAMPESNWSCLTPSGDGSGVLIGTLSDRRPDKVYLLDVDSLEVKELLSLQ